MTLAFRTIQTDAGAEEREEGLRADLEDQEGLGDRAEVEADPEVAVGMEVQEDSGRCTTSSRGCRSSRRGLSNWRRRRIKTRTVLGIRRI